MLTLEKARLYEQFRLPYAAELAEDLLQRTGPLTAVADVGAGTGQLARLFARPATQVFAVEPDPAMRQVGMEVLAGNPSLLFVPASAERTTLAGHSVDLVVIGNAFHRFRPEACAELRRILRPRGWVAVINYVFTDPAFADALFSRLSRLPGLAGRMAQSWHRLPMEALFGEAALTSLGYRQSQAVNWEAFFGSACSGIEAPAPHAAEFAPFEIANREVFETFAVGSLLTIQYETRVTLGQPA